LVEVEGSQYLVEVEVSQYLIGVEGSQYLIEVKRGQYLAKLYDFLAYNRDFSHEIPQTFSRLPVLGAIFLRRPS
jgi:hypothetical protein